MDRKVAERSILRCVRDSNAARLDRLHRQGVQVVLEGPDVLRFLLERVLVTESMSEFDRSWTLDIDRLLNEVEAITSRSDIKIGRSSTGTAEGLTVSFA